MYKYVKFNLRDLNPGPYPHTPQARILLEQPIALFLKSFYATFIRDRKKFQKSCHFYFIFYKNKL